VQKYNIFDTEMDDLLKNKPLLKNLFLHPKLLFIILKIMKEIMQPKFM
jgi:hypothetical protein